MKALDGSAPGTEPAPEATKAPDQNPRVVLGIPARGFSASATTAIDRARNARGLNLSPGHSRTCSSYAADSIVARDRAVVRCGAAAEVEQDLVDVTPPPALRRVIAFDDWMARLVKMLGGVAVRRVVAAADMAAGST